MFFEKLYNLIYHIGFTAGSGFMKFGKWLSRGLSRPVKTVGAVFFAVFLVIDKFILKTFKTVSAEFKLLRADIKRVSSGLNSLIHTDRKSAEAKLRIYIKKAFSRHGIVFTFAVNLLVPIICLGVLCSTIGYWNKATLALEIKYNGSVIGYAKNESEYLDAEQQAKTRLKTAASASGKEQELIKPAQYQLKVVNKTDLTDSSSMCDKLIENSDSNITNACGIYINGDFLCAVKNETDATSVFDKILSDYKIDDPNAAKSFVENITYEQGLYPDNEATVWDAEKLSAKLKSKKSEAVYYTVKDGDTVSGIASANGLTVSELMQLNPGLSETIRSGDKLLVSSEVNYVRVQVTKTETHNEAIAYTSTNVNNANLYTGTKKVTTKGVNGVQQVTELVTYIDGTRVSSKEVSRVTLSEPVNEVIQIGTKAPITGKGGSGGKVITTGGRFVWPAIGATSVSSGYGGARRHGGIDIVKPGGGSTGLTIVAAASGTVTTATYHPSWGYYIVINHGNGLSTLYAHTLPGSFKVRVGQKVSAGQPIANIGSSGNVTGPHLHFEVYVNGRRTNPMPYLGR